MNAEIHPGRVLIKALSLFILVNLLYALIEPQDSRVSAYNVFFPGRTRLPFGISDDPYTVMVDDLDTMFRAHLIAAPKGAGEFRVALIGDSSVWGENIGAYEVISEQWNKLNFACRERIIRVYNLGYPHPSVVKDLVILDKALEYEPDLIIWFVTLNTLISRRVNPFLVTNRERAMNVLDAYDISFDPGHKLAAEKPSLYEKTLIGQRSNLARRIKLEMLGIIWTATGADTDTLAEDDPPNFDVGDDSRYRGKEAGEDITNLLLFSALSAGHEIAGSLPVLIVNEPMFIAPRADTMIRYNGVYPRWVYDQYRQAMAAQAQNAGWIYLDLWNAVPPQYFSDAGLHLSAQGERLLIEQINPALQALACN